MNIHVDNAPKPVYKIIIDGSLYWKSFASYQACQKEVANLLGFAGNHIEVVKVVQKQRVTE